MQISPPNLPTSYGKVRDSRLNHGRSRITYSPFAAGGLGSAPPGHVHTLSTTVTNTTTTIAMTLSLSEVLVVHSSTGSGWTVLSSKVARQP